ncbi:MAG: tRNA (adenosine(37)-N6)-threonylcarbamoyltransferase complex dimerization subunit type 1 TsaB [Bdellovibrionota bacterium]
MIVLALDTSTARGGVAVFERDRVLSSRSWDRKGSHSEFLTAEIESCLKDAGRTVRDLERLALGNGPGSFTGIRVAVNAARSLAYALTIPIAVFDTTEILSAAVARRDLPVVTLVNAQKNAVFAATFVDGSRTSGPTMVEAGGLDSLLTTPHLCVGDGYVALFPALTPTLIAKLVRDPAQSDFPSAETLGRIAWESRDTRPPLVWKDAQALYIRASGAEENLKA